VTPRRWPILTDEDRTAVARVLDRGVLSNALGGAFSPGAEVNWIMRNPSIYSAPYRIKADRSVSNFLETADHAFEFVDEHDPAALEIHRTHGAAQETVWNYSASRAAAVKAERKDLAQTFGFDPTIWGKKR